MFARPTVFVNPGESYLNGFRQAEKDEQSFQLFQQQRDRNSIENERLNRENSFDAIFGFSERQEELRRARFANDLNAQYGERDIQSTIFQRLNGGRNGGRGGGVSASDLYGGLAAALQGNNGPGTTAPTAGEQTLGQAAASEPAGFNSLDNLSLLAEELRLYDLSSRNAVGAGIPGTDREYNTGIGLGGRGAIDSAQELIQRVARERGISEQEVIGLLPPEQRNFYVNTLLPSQSNGFGQQLMNSTVNFTENFNDGAANLFNSLFGR